MGRFIEAWRNGQVTRKHTMENIRAENDAEHSWGVVLLLIAAWPKVPPHVVKMAIIHDCGERAVGDMPGPTKWANPVLGDEMDKMEKQHILDTMPQHLCLEYMQMKPEEWAVIEFFDRAEFCISMSRERRLGNTYAMLYYERSFNKMVETWRQWRDKFDEMDPELNRELVFMYRELKSEFSALKQVDTYSPGLLKTVEE